MPDSLPRREFLKTMAATGVLAGVPRSLAGGWAAVTPPNKIQTFNYDGVRLGKSRWNDQYLRARDFYFNVSNDDILQGFRAAAGLPAPGKPLGGWCEKDTSVVFGQWLSGMSRMYRATGDTAMRDKATYLLTEFGKTVGPDGNCRMSPYPYEKLTCGLVDMHEYANDPQAMPLLSRATDYASKTFDRTRAPANPEPWEMHSGKPLEWYTLPENLLRAYALTGNEQYKDFADVWLYHAYWNKFARTAAPDECVGRACVQSRQYVQQRGDGVRGDGRSDVSANYQERVRLPAEHADLRYRWIRTGGTNHAGGQPGQGAGVSAKLF